MHLALGVAIFAAIVCLAFVVVTRKGADPRVRLIALGLIVPLGFWGSFSYGPELLRWVSQLMSHEVHLSWNAPVNSPVPIAGYYVYRAPAGSSSYHRLNWTVVTQTKFVDLTVQSGQSYDYVVKSVDALSGAESVPSNAIRITVPWMPYFASHSKSGIAATNAKQ
jgi:hypothetical protein